MGKKHKKHHRADPAELEDLPPVKLTIKVGTPDPHADEAYLTETHVEKKHKHKKKKKKHKHHKDKEASYQDVEPTTGENTEQSELEDVEAEASVDQKEDIKVAKTEKPKESNKRPIDEIEGEVNITEEPNEPYLKKIFRGEDYFDRKAREPRGGLITDKSPLNHCLEYLQRVLSRKDINGFFSFPVNDVIAPGYSAIVSQPMDFSTMKSKVENDEYPSVTEYKKDFKLMCDNAMLYNHPDTVYYKAANKLLNIGLKTMSKEKLLQLKKNLSLMQNITDVELGVDKDDILVDITSVDNTQTPLKPKEPQPLAIKTNMYKAEAIRDNLSSKQILAQAEQAAQDAADRLAAKSPKSKMGFLKRRKDGTTTLNILNPDNDGVVNEKERVITLGNLIGKVTQGTGQIAGFKEDKRNKINPVHYLQYGPFSSYAPVYDSSFSNLSKDESDFLITAYGDEPAAQFAQSLQNFVGDAGDYAIRMVDSLLGVLTGGDHFKSKKVMQEKQREKEEKKRQEEEEKKQLEEREKAQKQMEEAASQKDRIENLRSLSEIGIDTSFLDSFVKGNKLQSQLDETSQLISDLQSKQNDRLTQKPPSHLQHVQGPSTEEKAIAGKVTKNLAEITKQATPADVISAGAVRRALGVTVEPLTPPPVPVEDPSSMEGNAMQQSQSEIEHTEPNTQIQTLEASNPSEFQNEANFQNEVDGHFENETLPSAQTQNEAGFQSETGEIGISEEEAAISSILPMDEDSML
ncbi:unnamed protein product [Owenia fusiformis]|uniref:Uncharacterized protein n=1 Tax=Owenia fusiformis TaxID=6347 RepID=A0A8J1TST2_OWEFU|nr:unnamed protein product [Owenia fusiformis]